MSPEGEKLTKQLLRGGNFNYFWSSLTNNILTRSLEWLAKQLQVRVTEWNDGMMEERMKSKRPQAHRYKMNSRISSKITKI